MDKSKKNKGEIKQIILVTDGHSNIGQNPALAAKKAKENNIIVNAIGIISNNKGISEVKEIAEKGGGEYQIVDINDLSSSMVMVTQKSVNATLQEVVNKQLKEMTGSDITETPPLQRENVVNILKKVQDEINIKCIVLIDSSGSMENKFNEAKNSILNLLETLKARKGNSEIAVLAFPRGKGENTKLISDFTSELGYLKNRLGDIKASGGTPTGPAIIDGIQMFLGEKGLFYEELV